jgi:hypothetical protein
MGTTVTTTLKGLKGGTLEGSDNYVGKSGPGFNSRVGI